MKTLLTVFLLCIAFAVQAQIPLPEVQHRVNDFTNTLSQSEIQQLSKKLTDLETQKGSQLVIVLVSSTKPETIQEFCIRLTDKYKIGRKGTSDGVLLLIAKNDRKMRIETGYGLEATIPDAKATQICSEIIAPYFKKNDFYGGINQGIDVLTTLVKGDTSLPASDYKPQRKQVQNNSTNGNSTISFAWIGWIVLFFIAIIALAMVSTISKNFGSAGLWIGGIALFIIAVILGGFLIAVILAILWIVIGNAAKSGSNNRRDHDEHYNGGNSSSGGFFFFGGGDCSGYGHDCSSDCSHDCSSDCSSDCSWGGGDFGGGGGGSDW